MKKITTFLALSFLFSTQLAAQSNDIQVQKTNEGWVMMVDGEPLMINGMNWDYFPRGTNYSYSLWNQEPAFIKQALDYEMGLLQNMGVNAIRVYTGIQPEWITYIYENYGIYTMLNHSFGRYGLTLDGVWTPNTDYGDPRVRELLLAETTQLVSEYQDTPGLLLFLLGNENNYGLFWEGAETEDIPMEDRKSTQKAIDMYKLFNEATLAMKNISTNHPIALCNGDLLFMDQIAEHAPDIDIFGTNTYRGISFTDLYERVANEYDKPVLLTEFGSDAFNARTLKEAQGDQAYYQKGNWKEIYENAAGMGKNNNSIGGFTFQFSDGWWKYGQVENLDIHDINASWANGGYQFDFANGQNNMNEEWFGITAKGPTDPFGYYELFPRASYYVLQEAHRYDVYDEDASLYDLEKYFDAISIQGAVLKARGDKAALEGSAADIIRLSQFTADFRTYSTGGTYITTPEEPNPNEREYPTQQGFDHLETFFIGVEANPAPNIRANLVTSILGNVPGNPIDEIFYENRGRPVDVEGPNGDVTLTDVNRVAIYSAEYEWTSKYFDITGFYRTGRYHWGYEGDFFGLYPEANYGPNIDIYNGTAPFGFEVEGRYQFDGLKAAFGPELWWGANPAFLIKYTKMVGQTQLTGIFHEDLEQQRTTESSFAIPRPKTRRLTLYAAQEFGKLGVEVGGIWAGQPLNGREFQLVRENEDGTYNAYVDEIKPMDNFGAKMKLTYTGGLINWYGQGAIQGLVANGGADQTQTFTGWRLKDSGSGNQMNVLSGFTYTIGNLQIAPNFLWQKPIEGPIPAGLDGGARPRNYIDDPFAVRSNREQTSGELVLTWDPTPGTWMYNWDSNRSEDAKLAISLGVIYRHLPTVQDAAIGILPDGRSTFAFNGSAPAEDLIEVNARVVSKLNRDLGFVAVIYGGEGQANGNDPRKITRFGTDLQMIYKNLKLNSFARFNDWGPFDYNRDFNQTYPVQLMADFSTTLGKPDWFDLPTTRLGVRGTYRSLNRYSPRYSLADVDDATGEVTLQPGAEDLGYGSEWEIRTYIQIDIRN
ncbi:MAG: glycosidase [Balneolaceae bacterium]|nr:glycosidase [Balneolaceae bacterium]